MIANTEYFNTIENVYEYIDINALDLDRHHDITNVWVKFRDATLLNNEKQLAQWELEFFLFSFRHDKVFSLSYSNGKKPGKVKPYPDLDKVQSKAVEYLKQRTLQSKNPLITSRYNHLLWKGIKGVKNKTYAINAIESYFKLIREYVRIYNINKDKNFTYQIGQAYERVISICSEVKHGITELKEVTNFLLYKNDDVDFFIKEGIITEMLSFPQIFKKEDFVNAITIFETGVKNIGKDDFLWINNYLPIAIKVARKINADVKKWHNEIGLAYLRISEPETDENRFWLKLDNYSKAIDAFTLAHNQVKRLEAEQLYADLKPMVKLESVTVSFDEETSNQIRKDQEAIKVLATETLKRHPFLIYKSLGSDPVLPELKNIVEESKTNENQFWQGINTTYFDNNKNVSKPSGNKLYSHELFTTYAYTIKFSVLPFLHYIFILGIKSNHLTYKNFLHYLLKYTWIGKPYKKIDLGGEEIELNWINILTPSIVEYFIQIQAWTNSKYYTPSFILCLDSLTIKIEGLLRNFCERLHIPTSRSRKKGMQELHMNELLAHESLKTHFAEEDMLLLNYVFSNEGGLNLRNNIAHCFYNQNEYHPDKMLLLLEILLRISKYDPTVSSSDRM